MPISMSRTCMASSRTRSSRRPPKSRNGSAAAPRRKHRSPRPNASRRGRACMLEKVSSRSSHPVSIQVEEHAMPDSSLTQQPSALANEMRAYTGLFTEKTFDWDAFPARRGFPDLLRAQLRYVGAGGSPKSNDPTTLKAEHFTFSLVNQPVGKFAGSHAHEVVEHFFILQGVLTVGTVWGDEVVEVKLGPGDLLLNKSGRPHGFRNEGVEPVLMSITVGSGRPLPPSYSLHPRDGDSELAARFGAAPGKPSPPSPASDYPKHRTMSRHIVRYSQQPVKAQPGFAKKVYIGE